MEPTLDLTPGRTGPIPLPLPTSPSHNDPARAEKDALRIQAAAVVAQQAALMEEEARLAHRRTTLEQQESQLAAHLEERRRKLLQMAEQAQSARSALERERAAHDRHAAKTRAELEQTRLALQEGQREVQTDRQRLADLAQRMKRRWHRNWQAERQAMLRREVSLAAERDRLEGERTALVQERLRSNGEVELSRRQLQDAWGSFREARRGWQEEKDREQAAIRELCVALGERDAALTDSERALADERYHWERRLVYLKREADGLEARAQNQRHKVQEAEGRLAWLEQRLREASALPTVPAALVSLVPSPPASEGCEPPVGNETSAPSPQPQATEALTARESEIRESERLTLRRAASLDLLAEDLADQYLQLLEQWEWQIRFHLSWHQEREALLVEVHALATGLPEKEEALTARVRLLESAEEDLRGRHEELQRLRQHVEGWHARLEVREAEWQSERDRLLLDVRGREQLARRHLEAVVELRRRWAQRRRQELDAIRAERSACERLRRECAALREELGLRTVALQDELRSLAEKSLALEQYRQQFVVGAEDAAAAERNVERMQKQWQSLNDSALRAASAERERLRKEMADLEQRQTAFHKHTAELAAREAQLAQRQTNWEEAQTLTDLEQARSRQEIQSLQGQRDRYALHLKELQDEIERIARVLLEESDPLIQVSKRAA